MGATTRERKNATFGRVARLSEITASVVHVVIETEEQLSFAPGQHVAIRLQENGPAYYYSIASEPDASHPHRFELLVGRAKSGPSPSLGLDARVIVDAPAGTDILALVESERPLNLIGMGTGVAPLRSIARFCERAQPGRVLSLLAGARDSASLPFHAEFLERAKQLNFRYFPVFSRSRDESHWLGHVQDHLEQCLRLDGFSVLCGSTAMVAETRARLRSLGIKEDDIYGEGYGD